ncbi:MAG TPA: alpha/beta hydrolase [Casimicrobiaceae bacterium]|nr:alpha/beta hydrolase [Casimicrobiaceae bacterium]
MPYVTTQDNCKLYVKDWGTGRPVILIHGWPLSADSFDDLSMAIADSGMRAIAYDRRGFGRSEQPWSGYDYDTLADDLASVIQQSGSDDATIVGFSMGGGEVARYMSRHGARNVRSAILIASVVPYLAKSDDNPEGVDRGTMDKMTMGLEKDRAEFFKGFFKDFYGVGLMSHPVSDGMLEWSRQVAMQASLRATLACAKAFATTDFRQDLGSFHVPTLVIHGDADKTVPIAATARKAAEGIRDSTLIEYDDAPHGLFATHKDRLTDDVVRFLRGERVSRRSLTRDSAMRAGDAEAGMQATARPHSSGAAATGI